MLPRPLSHSIPLTKIAITSSDPTSIWECATLSSHVYGGANQPALPPGGWSVYANFSIGSYASTCYVKNLNSTNAVITFAHRGTDNIENILIDDLLAILGKKPRYFSEIYDWQYKIHKELNLWCCKGTDKENQFTIYQTGHSLGGVYADLFAILFNITQEHLQNSITFENPGSFKSISECILEFLYEQHGCSEEDALRLIDECRILNETYLADINIINSCSEQTGKSFKVDGLAYDYLNGAGTLDGPLMPFKISNRFTDNSYYMLTYSLQQHAIEPLRLQLKYDNQFSPVSYPIGCEQGYLAYLNVENRKQYWDNYLKACWDTLYPQLKVAYKDNWDSYYQDAIRHIKSQSTQLRLQIQTREGVFTNPENRRLSNERVRLFSTPTLEVEDFEILNPDEELPPMAPEKSCLVM